MSAERGERGEREEGGEATRGKPRAGRLATLRYEARMHTLAFAV